MTNNLPERQPRSNALLQLSGLSKHYVRGGWWRNRVSVAAVNGVDFGIPIGQTLALIGASGSGKSTVARCVTRLERPDGGQIWIRGSDIAQLGASELLPLRSKVQMVFQDAATAMNPRFSAAHVIEEPLLIQGRGRSERREVAERMMKEVSLSPEWLNRPIMDFSGGQRQRLAIARALSLKPELLVLDEALSGLDLSTQAQVANLLLDLQQAHSLTYLLISHDLTMVSRMAQTIAVMSAGRIVEIGPTAQLMAEARHPEARKLLEAARTAERGFAFAAGAGS
ncbi:MAG: ABC transporter ATP-binding protein [Acidobacteria bacterium]|nr:MAG: ABC transporter ATP-binding protein [Acidobacteriota bacterium]